MSFGFKTGRFSAILVSAWINFPVFWEKAGLSAKKHGIMVKAGKAGVIAAGVMVITEIIMEADENFT